MDVLPLVMQQTGDGHAVPHDVIYNVPYIRVQGGKTAIILDPQVGILVPLSFVAAIFRA